MPVYRTRATLLLPSADPPTESSRGTRRYGEPTELPIRCGVKYRGGRQEDVGPFQGERWDAIYETVRPPSATLAAATNFTAWRLRDEDRPGRPTMKVVHVEFPEAAGRTLMRIFVVFAVRGA